MITPELVAKVKAKLISSRASYDHFFATIQDPAWIAPLAKEGFFKNPDPAIRQGDYISYSFWPESQYLLRMADKVPDEVLEVAIKIPDTDNQRVMEDIVQILLKVDVNKAVRQTDKVVGFIEKASFLRVQDYAADLAVKFAEAGQIGAALRIAETMLEVKPDPKAKDLKEDDDDFAFAMLEPQIRYRDYEYQEIAKKLAPALAKADPTKAIAFFSDLLDKAVRYKLIQYSSGEDIVDDEDAVEDYSAIWRPDIADSERTYEQQPRHGLVSSLRDCIVILLESDLPLEKKRKLLDQVCAQKFVVFKRIVEYVLRDHKDEDSLKDLYQKLVEELNPITDATQLQRMEFNEFTPSAGITLEELQALSDDELIDKLKNYVPPEIGFGREALADLVTVLIKNNPGRYLKLSSRIFEETKDRFANSILTAAADTTDSIDEEQIKDVLAMSKLFLAAKPQENEDDDTRDSGWARMSITRLAYKLVSQKPNKEEHITVETAKELLDLLLILCRDPDPTVEHEAEYGGDNMDPPTLSVNTTRGEALHSLARMAGWARRNNGEDYFLPKIYQELEWHLDTNNDPSVAIRAVYGQWFPWIWDSNKKWTEVNINKIFSADRYGDAAWGAYLTLNQVFNDVFKFLEPVFRQRLVQLEQHKELKNSRFDSRQHFSNHLMVAYWRGLVDLEEGGIIREFFNTADVHYRAEALRFVGFEARKGPEVDPVIKERLIKLWEYRLKEVEAHPERGVAELEQFGTWFSAKSFDKQWAISTLLASLKIAGNADPDFMVVERLEELVDEYPVEAMEGLVYMIKGARERWAIDSWRDHTLAILKSAFNSGNDKAKELAVEQANLLVAKGYHMFREALK